MIDDYGNKITSDGDYVNGQQEFCSFPDCGCDGHRLCQAKNGASEMSFFQNKEGMWSCNNPRSKAARQKFVESQMNKK